MASERLRSTEQQDFIERLAELAESGMPLPAGLRAAAAESGSRRLSNQFRRLAKQFESGTNWEAKNLDEASSALPPYILGSIRAGIQSGNLGDVLNRLVDQERSYRDVWRQMFLTLAYPLTLGVMTTLLLVLAMVMIVRPMKEVLQDFGTELPPATEMWIRLSDDLPGVLAFCAIAFLVLVLGIRLIGGRVAWARFIEGIPVFGHMIHLAGVSQMLRLLEVMLTQNMPLGDALRLASSGAVNANMQLVSEWLAQGVEAGVPLSDLMDLTPRLPATIVPVIRWGERHGTLAEAIRSAYEMLEGSIRHQGSTVSALLGPLMLVFVGAAIGLLAISMMMPMVSLTQNLL